MATLWLLETRAAKQCTCAGCKRIIQKGEVHFRHDPHPRARQFRGERITHWCTTCIEPKRYAPKEFVTNRIRVPVVNIIGSHDHSDRQLSFFAPVKIECIDVAASLSEALASQPDLVHKLTPPEFEEFVCERLFAMGMEPRRVSNTYRPDGGIDVVFWPRAKSAFPFLGAAQVKHHRDHTAVEGPSTVRDFVGSLAGKPFAAGLIVTNTSFSPSAEWFARAQSGLVRLRTFKDICRWLANDFGDDEEWRELPSSIEVAPGVIVRLRT